MTILPGCVFVAILLICIYMMRKMVRRKSACIMNRTRSAITANSQRV